MGTDIRIFHCDEYCCGARPRHISCSCGCELTGVWKDDEEAIETWNYRKSEDLNMEEVKVGDLVEFKGKDSYFKGTLVCIFTKLDGKSVRCCVQDDRGLLLIKNPRDAVKI